MSIKMKIIEVVLLIFSVSLAQALDLKDENTSNLEPQVRQLKNLFSLLPVLLGDQ